MTGDVLRELAVDRADWLLDAIACATQDRRFLRGDEAYDAVAGEAILLNGQKAISVAIEKALSLPRSPEDGEGIVGRLRARKSGWKSNISYADDAGPLVNPDGPEAADRIGALEEALRKAAARFREYEKLHLAKLLPERTPDEFFQNARTAHNEDVRAKADRNREMAELCEAALSSPTRGTGR